MNLLMEVTKALVSPTSNEIERLIKLIDKRLVEIEREKSGLRLVEKVSQK